MSKSMWSVSSMKILVVHTRKAVFALFSTVLCCFYAVFVLKMMGFCCEVWCCCSYRYCRPRWHLIKQHNTNDISTLVSDDQGAFQYYADWVVGMEKRLVLNQIYRDVYEWHKWKPYMYRNICVLTPNPHAQVATAPAIRHVYYKFHHFQHEIHHFYFNPIHHFCCNSRSIILAYLLRLWCS